MNAPEAGPVLDDIRDDVWRRILNGYLALMGANLLALITVNNAINAPFVAYFGLMLAGIGLYTRREQWSYRQRVGMFLGMWASLALFNLVWYGFTGPGPVFLVAWPVLAVFLLGGAVLRPVVGLSGLLWVGVGAAFGLLHLSPFQPLVADSFASWLLNGMNLLLVAVALIFLPQQFDEVQQFVLSEARQKREVQEARAEMAKQAHTLELANEALAHRALQLQTSSQVGQRVTSVLDLEKLMGQVVQVIQERFRYYFIGVWLLTPDGQTVVLRASAGRAGEQMQSMNLELPLTTRSLVTSVCRTGLPRLANLVTHEPEYYAYPGLPEARSELVLPLRAGEMVLGAFDVVRARASAFLPEDQVALQTLADQIAIAVRNAQLYNEIRAFNTQLEAMVHERTEELHKAYHALERLNSTKSTFVEITAHELRTPLTVVKGYAQVLGSFPAVKSEAALQELLEGIISGINRMHELVNSLLDVLKIDSQTLTVRASRITLAPVVRQATKEFAAALVERRLSLVIEALDTLPPLEADPDLLRKVIYQVVINAIKYTPDGGAITIRGQAISTGPEAPCLDLTVQDTGIGIAPENHELIFEKFYQTGQAAVHSSGKTKFKGGGPGLGLAIARGIVLAHKGKIWVESPGYDETRCPGSCFFIRLPLPSPFTNSEPTA